MRGALCSPAGEAKPRTELARGSASPRSSVSRKVRGEAAGFGRFRRKWTKIEQISKKMPQNGPKWADFRAFLVDFEGFSKKSRPKFDFLFRPKMKFSIFFSGLEISFSTKNGPKIKIEAEMKTPHFRKCRTRHRHEITVFGIQKRSNFGCFWSSKKLRKWMLLEAQKA